MHETVLNPVFILDTDIRKEKLFALLPDMCFDQDHNIVFTKSADDIPRLMHQPLIIAGIDSGDDVPELIEQIKERNSSSIILLIIPWNTGAVMINKIVSSGIAGIVRKDDYLLLACHIELFFAQKTFGKAKVSSVDFLAILERGYLPDITESMISVIDADLKYRSVNNRFCQTMSVMPEDVIGRKPSDVWGCDIFNSVIESNLRKSLSGEVIKYKARFSGEEFKGRDFEVIYRPWKPDYVDENLLVVETREITGYEEARKNAESIGLRSNYLEKYLPFGLFDCDRRGKILFANRTFFNIAGISTSGNGRELLVDSLFPSDKRFLNYLETVVKGEVSTFGQMIMRRSDGTNIFVRVTSHARPDQEHGIVINSILEEITREVMLERKLSSIHRMETLGTLAGGIAHDFNTILTTISGYAELTREETGADTEIYGYMERISGAIRKAEDVINQMLTFSRQVDQERIAVGITAIVREACDFVSSASPDNIILQTDLNSDDLVVMADPTQLFRVFLNILTNGVQAMEVTGGILKVTAEADNHKSRLNARVVISDTGSGIDSSVIDHIFEPFFTTKDVGKGTGMGLSVAHGIITSLGGEMEVESKPGQGTRFIISLPMTESDEDGHLHNSGDEHRTILYADSDIYFSRTLSLALGKVGFRVLMATTPEDISLMTDGYRDDISISILRTDRDSDTAKLIKSILSATGKAPMVLIAPGGIDHFRRLDPVDKRRVTLAGDPVSLRDILNAINDNC